MNYKISKNEKIVIERVEKAKIPTIYKMDLTDNILFVELVSFDVCQLLLKGKPVKKYQYDNIMNEYQKFLAQVNTDMFDDNATFHYKDIVKVMEIFEKNCKF